MKLVILGQGSAVPEYSIGRDESLELALKYFAKTEKDTRALTALYRMSGVEKRHSVLLHAPEGSPQDQRQSFMRPPQDELDGGPRLGERMEVYEREAPPLALKAARKALEDAGIDPERITHLVTVSCSGFSAPGVDVGLIDKLGLSRNVERAHVGFMGCHGALNGLRVAEGFARRGGEAMVLLCAVELCTLHYHYGLNREQLVSNSLFGDGAAALVGAPRDDPSDAEWSIQATGSCLIPDSQDAMTWRIRDHGFAMTLSPRVPKLIADELRSWMETWLDVEGLSLEDINTWAIHPGGPRILSSVTISLDLPRSVTETSREVLRDYGNMSSPTILFILERLRARQAPLPCVALAFGPGLMAEATLFA